ncbi:MAG: RNase adapter RapZ [Pseudobdellovibrionaceae bacterium]
MGDLAGHRPVIFFVTGLSGAGMSSALSILEDIGFAVFDNFPLSLLPALLQQEETRARSLAVSFDSRALHFDPMLLLSTIKTLKDQGVYTIKTLFLSADDAVLLKRFSETRRIHPLARDRAVADGIAAEKGLLFPLKHEAGYVIDTSEYSIHDLRRVIERFADGVRSNRLNITVMSFSYRHGLPREADLVLDVRFLRNPNWDGELKDKTGLEVPVQAYVMADAGYPPFIAGIETILRLLLPRYAQEGKSYLTLAFGCTGGRHRSVTVAEQMAAFIRQDMGLEVLVHHRELKK